MGSVPIGRVGKIVSGDEAGWFVKVLDDSDATGGFLILTSREDHFVSGFDNWVADENALKQYLHEARWLIEWVA
ncbi:hypothetical protein GCM10011611_37480 [Aliidongia dinghuensis]|uniref:Uncharacterized protein n=1 Tax=Aliidongia dinghuensis TaxID=1867774 RepID=A0A8J2YVF1_9PROT|nr:hypothetical protein [Aliidongia dinghuensis]GGF27966.1 hypothetical protein GCM10011611_37480 [Aliidongia dinghuensis]